MTMNSIPHGRSTLLRSFSLRIYTFLPLVHVLLSVSLCLFLYLCQHCLPLYVINLAYNSVAVVSFHLGLVLFCISECFTFPFLEVLPCVIQLNHLCRCTKSPIRDHTFMPVWSVVSSVLFSEHLPLDSPLVFLMSSAAINSQRFPVQRACSFSFC